ncbi:hypothetical protein YC2023_007570 [Brassica napus]
MESLPTTVSSKPDRRGKSSKSQNTSKPSLIMAFFSSLAWPVRLIYFQCLHSLACCPATSQLLSRET